MREATCFCLHKKCNFSKLSRSLKVRKIEFVLKYLIDDYVNNLFFSSPQLLCVRKKYSNPYICQCVWCNYHIHSMASYYSLNKINNCGPYHNLRDIVNIEIIPSVSTSNLIEGSNDYFFFLLFFPPWWFKQKIGLFDHKQASPEPRLKNHNAGVAHS